jgi:hypothetical protein
MVNNQDEFNNKFPKEIKEIKLKNKEFIGQLVIENYPNLKKLHLRNVKSIDKVNLRNLTQLQECTISDCGVQELVFENCSQVKELDIADNSLTNLEFLISLENLEKLKLERNAELVKILEPYQGDWKNYKKDKDIQEIFELTKQNNLREIVKKYLDLKKSREDLKLKFSKISKKTQQPTTSKPINTTELVLNLGKEFEEKEARIYYLESRTQELIDLSKQQKDKIINAYLTHFGKEKELAKNLVEEYLEFIKFKKQEINSLDYDERCEDYEDKFKNIKKQLRTVLNKEAMNGVQRVLTDCEKLVEQELELETKLGDSKSLLIEGKEHLSQVPRDNREETNRQLKLKLVKTEEQLKTNREQPITQQVINYINCNIVNAGDNSTFINQTTYQQIQYQQLEADLEQQTSRILTDQEITPQDQQVINQTIIFSGAQELFVDYRQRLLDKLIDGYCQLAKKTKWTKWATFGSNLTGIGSKIAGAIPKGTIAQNSLGIIGDTISLATNITQERNLEKYRQKLQEILTKDKEALNLFDSYYHPLTKTIWNNQDSSITTQIIKTLDLKKERLYPFSQEQDPFKGIFGKEKGLVNFSSDQLKDFLIKLENNLKEFQQSFQKQRDQLAQQDWFKAIETQTGLLQEQQAQIQVNPNQ